jgi:Bax protein
MLMDLLKNRFTATSFLALFLLFSLAACSGSPIQEEDQPPAIITVNSRDDLSNLLASLDYDWQTLDRGVPSIILENFPADLGTIREVTEKKRIFFLSLLPMVLLINHEISQQRDEVLRILHLHEQGKSLSEDDRSHLWQLTRTYRLEGDPLHDGRLREELLHRIDTLPPSMVLAQAATESAYGTSRFALLGNNLFGQWTYSPGSGLVPEGRAAGKTHEVRRFPTLYDSVRSYALNLNTHGAYKTLRLKRAAARASGEPLRGSDLAEGLHHYSERRGDYVREIRAIIRDNQLASLSATTLRPL